MKITASHYDKTIMVETERDDMALDEVRDDLLIPILLALGFHHKTVNELFFETDDEYNREADIALMRHLKHELNHGKEASK